MLCSVFNATSGLYDYFETGTNVPFNADLPVPRMPAEAGKIGVAAVDAGRPLPSDARFVGRGWTAKGVIAHRNAGRSSMGSLGEVLGGVAGRTALDVTVAGLAGVGGYLAADMRRASRNYRLPAGVLAGLLSFVYLRNRG